GRDQTGGAAPSTWQAKRRRHGTFFSGVGKNRIRPITRNAQEAGICGAGGSSLNNTIPDACSTRRDSLYCFSKMSDAKESRAARLPMLEANAAVEPKCGGGGRSYTAAYVEP